MDNTPLQIFKKQRFRQILLSMAVVYAGSLMFVAQRFNLPLIDFIREHALEVLGVTLICIGLLLPGSPFRLALFPRTLRHEESFLDVDKRAEFRAFPAERILAELRELKASKSEIDYDRITGIIESARRPAPDKVVPADFASYFNSLREVLEAKAGIADQKASILLDKGTTYSKAGIWFFLISIITWQVLSWWKGFQTQFIYGIISCTALFIFMQFLSAWFLRQYRHFVETSTYLLKIKAIFDKYALSYFVTKDSHFGSDGKAVASDLLKLLSADIPWPDPDSHKRGDVNFAKESVENLSFIWNAIKEERQK